MKKIQCPISKKLVDFQEAGKVCHITRRKTSWLKRTQKNVNQCGHYGEQFSQKSKKWVTMLLLLLLLLLLSCFSRVRLSETPWTAAHQAPPSPGFSRQEHWSGLPFPSPMHESEVRPSNPIPWHIPRENYKLKRYIYLNVHCSTIYNSQDIKAT